MHPDFTVKEFKRAHRERQANRQTETDKQTDRQMQAGRQTGIEADRDRQTEAGRQTETCLLYTSPSPRDVHKSRMPSSA